MPETAYYLAATLDGFLAEEDGGLDWLLSLGSPSDTGYDAFYADVGAIAMGSSTYEWLLANAPGAWPYAVPTWVFTHRELPLPDTPGADVRFARGPVEQVHPELVAAAAGRTVWICGGGDLAAQYAVAGLLDRIRVTVVPVLLGSGIPFLPARLLRGLELLGAETFANGMVELDYRVSAAASRRLSQ